MRIKTTKSNHPYLYPALLSAVLVNSQALANQEDATTLNAITVFGDQSTNYFVPNAISATKTDTPIMETPVTIKVIPRAIMDDQQATSVGDVVQNVSGVQVDNTTAGGIYDNFIIRGFAGSPLIFHNGLRSERFAHDMANIERVEVLKGPASTLFGRIEPGGLINIVTKEASEKAHYSIEQQFGSYQHYRTAIEATGPIDEQKNVLYRVDMVYQDNDSFKDFLDLERFFIAPALTWKLSDKTRIDFKYEFQDDGFGDDVGIPAVGNRPAPVVRSITTAEDGGYHNHVSHLGELSWSHHFNDSWVLSNRFMTRHRDFNQREITSRSLAADQRTLSRALWDAVQDEPSYSVNLDLTGKFETFGVKHTTLVGYDYYLKDQEVSAALGPASFPFIPDLDIHNPVHGQVNFAGIDGLADNFFFKSHTEWHGIYFQDQLELFDSLHILLGGRYDWATQGSGVSAFWLPGTPSLAAIQLNNVHVDKFKPRFGIVYQPWQWLSVYANYVESLGATNGRSASGAAFKPQEANQVEAGIKTEFLDGKLSASLAVFSIEKENLLTSGGTINGVGFQSAIGEARSQGIEFDINGQLNDALNIVGSYAFLDTEITKDNNGLQGNRLALAAEHSGSMWLNYRFNEGAAQGLSISTGAFASSARQGDNNNSFALPGYVRWDAAIAYTTKVAEQKLTARINVENILDKHYYQGSDLFDGSPRMNIFSAAPISVYGSIKLEF